MEYAWNITGISEPCRYINGIYMVYTWYMKCICWPVRYIPCQYLMGLFRTFFYNDIPVMYYVDPLDIHSTSKVYHYKKRYGTNLWGIDKVYTGHISQVGIYISYIMYIPPIYHVCYIYIIHIPTLHLSLVYTMYMPCIHIYYILVCTINIACTSSLQGFVTLIGPQHRQIMAWRTTGQMFMRKLILISPIRRGESDNSGGGRATVRGIRRRESDNSGHPMEQYPSSWPKYGVALIVCQYHL